MDETLLLSLSFTLTCLKCETETGTPILMSMLKDSVDVNENNDFVGTYECMRCGGKIRFAATHETE